jgi:hypothetical protein
MFGFLLLIVISVKMGLGIDSLIVLGVFGMSLFAQSALNIDLTIMFVIALAIGIISVGLLKLAKPS